MVIISLERIDLRLNLLPPPIGQNLTTPIPPMKNKHELTVIVSLMPPKIPPLFWGGGGLLPGKGRGGLCGLTGWLRIGGGAASWLRLSPTFGGCRGWIGCCGTIGCWGTIGCSCSPLITASQAAESSWPLVKLK